ncbi:MAG: SDR family oxidoreductase [Lachnospiraceae bacterium]|nr:SDR family oxidoreductase [Lachnospiraceae bacterium]
MNSKTYALITGASSGIGAEFARRLAARGYALILVARREKRLRQLAAHVKTECEIITADLTRTEECYRVWEQIKDKRIEVFINNAGFGDCSEFLNSDEKKELDMIRLNVEAMHLLMKLVLRQMQQRDYGYILNVASSAGLLPAGPYMATYYATKAYVTSLTRAVAEELREMGSKVYVGCLCPGPVDTEFNRVANVEFALKGIRPGECASYALKQMAKRQVVIVPTATLKALTVFERFVPRKLLVHLIGKQQRTKLYGNK